MAGVYINRANPLQRKAGDKGYRIGWNIVSVGNCVTVFNEAILMGR